LQDKNKSRAITVIMPIRNEASYIRRRLGATTFQEGNTSSWKGEVRLAAPRRMKKILNLCESVESVVYFPSSFSRRNPAQAV
jgi:hypothetical protein